MSSSGGCGCCSKCGAALPEDVSACCLCVCDEICVTVSGGVLGTAPFDCEPVGTSTDSVCSCAGGKFLIPWDKAECAYVGTISCGGLTIDLRFEVKQCSNVGTGTGTGSSEGPATDCHLCLTSSCLNLSGVCPTHCREFTPGNLSGDCGKFLKDCDQSGGWNSTWTVDASGCGDADCTSVDIAVQCSDRINPAGQDQDRLCKDCDCVCECVCITYRETDCIERTVKTCWVADTGTGGGGYWEATFTGCPGGDQTIRVELVRDEVSGCCYWRLVTSRGQILEPTPEMFGTGTGTNVDELDIKTDCPNVNLYWTLDLSDEGTGTGTGENLGYISVRCSDCGECDTTFLCCPDDPLPATLTATFYNKNECNCVDGVEVTLNLIEVTVDESGNRTGQWRGDGVFCASGPNVCQVRVFLFCTVAGDWSLTWCTSDAVNDLDTSCSLSTAVIFPGACEGSSATPCCNPFFLPFGGSSASDDYCCNPPTTPASDFCIIVTE